MTATPDSVSADQLRAFVAAMEPPAARRVYVIERLNRLLGSSPYQTNRALTLAGNILGVRGTRRMRLWLFLACNGCEAEADAMAGPIDPKRFGYVYWARNQSNDAVVKVGFSTKPNKRVEQVSRFFGLPLKLERVTIGTMLDEFDEHVTHNGSRICWEFFSMPRWVAS